VKVTNVQKMVEKTKVSHPKISIIVPSYNSSRFIEETLQSIFNQNYPNLECIVIDGGSQDGTLDILRKYHDKIILRSEKDEGESDAINKGLKLAKGDIIAYIDTDDVYEPGAFKKVANFFANNPDVKWACGKCRYIDKRGVEIRKPITWFKNFWLRRYSYKKFLIMNFVPQPSTFWRRELIDEIGLFDINIYLVNDYEYGLRAGAKYKPGFIDAYLAKQRMHPDSVTSKDPLEQLKENVKVARRYTNSRVLITLNFLICFGIILVYSILNFASRFMRLRRV